MREIRGAGPGRRRWAFPGSVVAAVVLAVTLGTAAPAQAATSSWGSTQQTTYPTIYQTNWVYFGTAFTAPAGTPSTGRISSVSWRWEFLNLPPSLTTYTVYLCASTNGTNCLNVTPNWSSQAWSGSTTAFANFPANTTFQYAVYLSASTTYVVNPPRYSRSYTLDVTYNY
ncbi:flagellar protein FlhE [Micromonospora sp. WMMD882]|uniref:flagellar protein FlhE n=1 Tax=Micromonospora sp. WMMD882 TaxID=3015151 RepID=UPI00248B5DB9|nr:flagellar protein FlhE [Micromonospora sp. WMMD882]WBB80547.1 flagellar protein FlhE [Micromonospora sp. WMMD882]